MNNINGKMCSLKYETNTEFYTNITKYNYKRSFHSLSSWISFTFLPKICC